jgi:CRISPR system Cascade subunit CasD
MKPYLILKLEGVFQAWGTHTFEGLRNSENFPTRSGVLGLLGACLGIRRDDQQGQQRLGESIIFAARHDWDEALAKKQHGRYAPRKGAIRKEQDFHTILDARKHMRGMTVLPNTIIKRMTYLADAKFTLAIAATGKGFSLEELQHATRKPVFTPYLGRRCCPLHRPLCGKEGESVVVAENAVAALSQIRPHQGTIYSEEGQGTGEVAVRDVPVPNLPRHFNTRRIYLQEA